MAAQASTVAFDTLKAVRRLEGAGMNRGHAEAVAETVADAQGGAATQNDIAGLKEWMKAEMANQELRLVRAMRVQGGAVIAIIAALLKFLQ